MSSLPNLSWPHMLDRLQPVYLSPKMWSSNFHSPTNPLHSHLPYRLLYHLMNLGRLIQEDRDKEMEGRNGKIRKLEEDMREEDPTLYSRSTIVLAFTFQIILFMVWGKDYVTGIFLFCFVFMCLSYFLSIVYLKAHTFLYALKSPFVLREISFP